MPDGSSHSLDIVLFAMVAVFIGLRLFNVLGRRPPSGPADAPLRPEPMALPKDVVPPETPAPTPIAQALKQIAANDPGFSPDFFLQGAAAAFGMIVKAFEEGDENALRPLLSDDVFADFQAAIRARAAGEKRVLERLDIESADIVEARMDGRLAAIAVRFVSHQVVKSAAEAGTGTEQEAIPAVRVVDLWRFERDIRSSDPNWRLVATGSLET